MKINNRSLFFGDNLQILREKIPDESFDLIYLDPPFNSKRDYNILFKEGVKESQSQIKAFEDTWHWSQEAEDTFNTLVLNSNPKISNLLTSFEKIIGKNDVLAYLTMMTIRLIELHRVLKSTGSLYLHCDPTASHYLKIVLDTIFGHQNFRNEIVWCYATPSGSAKIFSRKHDIIFFYTKSNEYFFDSPRVPHKSGLHNTGQVFGGDYGDKTDEIKKMEEAGKKVEDWWVDIYPVDRVRRERLGYPTQKPEALLERIIKASSRENDFILDPFCGCGTTVAVAEKLKRNWVGIDISILAINLIKKRLLDQYPDKKLQLNIDGIPTDEASARVFAEKDPYQFQIWACDLIEAMPLEKKGADRGIDGVIVYQDIDEKGKIVYKRGIVQVKSGHVQRNQIATLISDTDREKAEFGIFITLEKPSSPMVQEALEAGHFKTYSGREYPKIQIITIGELLNNQRLNLPPVKPVYKKAAIKDTSEMTGLFEQ